jgi:zinc resistance-associated protein
MSNTKNYTLFNLGAFEFYIMLTCPRINFALYCWGNIPILEVSMRKVIIAAGTALALLGAPLAYAGESGAAEHREHEHWRPSEADLKAFTDARIAALKAGLQLTPEQEKNWPAAEQQIREMAKARQERIMKLREEERPRDAILRLRERADALTRRAQELRKLADAAAPLYESLTDDQKHRLRALVAMTMRPHMRYAGWRHEHEDHEHEEHEHHEHQD